MASIMMNVVYSCCYTENGKTSYIFSIKRKAIISDNYPLFTNADLTIYYNGVKYPYTGAPELGIPAIIDTNFYALYKVN